MGRVLDGPFMHLPVLPSSASTVPAFVVLKVIRDVLLLGHRQAFAWVDEWIGTSVSRFLFHVLHWT